MIKNKLKDIRMREYAMNQTEFSELLDISISQYNRYENNTGYPSLEIALKIAYKLNKDVKDIFSLVD